MFEPTPSTREQPIAVTVGHWTDVDAATGCTVVLFDRPAPAVVDIRGGAPGTRETDVLGGDRLGPSGRRSCAVRGERFGLSVADGVMAYLRDLGRGVARQEDQFRLSRRQ